ncbi:hypothetical protein SYNPS1DRAFT_24542, partial [Syncephalis pseudoplumigaleata]
MKKARDTLVAQLKALAQEKRQVTADTPLQTRLSELETRLAYAKEELSATARKLAAVQQQASNAQAECSQIKPRISQMQASMAALDDRIRHKEREIHAVEDEMFAEFCRNAGLTSIRDYEQGQLQVVQQNDEKRLQFTMQHTKLSTQLAFEQQQLDELIARMARTEKLLGEEVAQLETNQHDLASIGRGEEDVANGLRKVDAAMEQQREQMAAQNEVLSRCRSLVGQLTEQVSETTKAMVEKESDLEKLGSDRLLILRRCRLDGVKLPFLRGSLEDVPMENGE